ncbi:MAG: hypothetical protein JW745_02885 [Sedimentisphaerales bacterium]|nr:hypothetical protein [Sedimentisphaerales bacterium]MBN2842657.1 hypothetical protein [Sedimentisphaerales bacterium]
MPEDFANSLDFNADGLVNMREFQFIAQSWLADPNTSGEPNDVWNEDCNLDNTGSSFELIDIADLAVFLEDGWLWQACWYEPYNSVTATMMATMARLPEPEIETLSLSRASSDNITTLARTTSKLLFVEELEPEEISQYAYMSNSELAEFVRDIKDLKDMVQLQADYSGEDSEDITEILDFFDGVLLDVKNYLTEQEE